LKNFRISEGISRVNLTKLSYYLKEKSFRRRDVVYKEGDAADGIYFIKDGEFEVSLMFELKMKNQFTLTEFVINHIYYRYHINLRLNCQILWFKKFQAIF
jgi:hypothetical protein